MDLYTRPSALISVFENVEYEADVEGAASPAGRAAALRGETGAQSSIMPLLVAFMKIPHHSTHGSPA
jgi:hypothetical protein